MHELTTTVGSSHRIGNLEATLFTCLSRQSAHSIEFFYDVIHHHLKIRAHVQHMLTLEYVKNARVLAQAAVSEAQDLLGEWEIRDNIDLNLRRVRVYLVERNDNEFSMVGSRRPVSTIVAWAHFTDDKDFIDDGVESFTYNLIFDHSYRDEHCFPFDVDQFDRNAHTVDGSNVRRLEVRKKKRSAATAVEPEEMPDDIPGEEGPHKPILPKASRKVRIPSAISTPEKTWEPSCSNKVRVKDSSFEVKLGLCVVRYREVLQLRLEVGSSTDIPVLRSLTLRRMESFLGIDGTSPITLSEGGFIGRFLDWFNWDEKHYPRKHILASRRSNFHFTINVQILQHRFLSNMYRNQQIFFF